MLATTQTRINLIAAATGLDPASAARALQNALLQYPQQLVDTTVQVVIATTLTIQASAQATNDYNATLADLYASLGSIAAPPPPPGPVPVPPPPPTGIVGP